MVKKFLKKRSKRVPARRRYKIEHKVRQHNKKLKKQSKHKPEHKKTKKDLLVPNSLPFKDKILQEAKDRRLQAEEMKLKRKEERHQLLMEKRGLEKIQKEVEKKLVDFENNQMKMEEEKSLITRDKSLKTYYKEFQKVVEAADVILEVLDARDPLGTRCPQVEEAVISSGTNKHLVLVLNKIDLIPKDNLSQWLKYLRNEFPTVSFKASTQNQREHLSQSKVPVLKSSANLLQSSHCLGANILMKLLGNYCRNKDIKTAITVGVVGFPNVGKSSIINSLKRSRACSVGSTPGVTKALQEIQIDKHIKLIDSPGIVLATNPDSSIMALHNAVKIENLPDPVQPVESIICRSNREHLLQYYKIPQFDNVHEFLALLAKRMGRLKKKGIPDVEIAARKLIMDWNSGKIKYFTHPPEEQKLPTYISAEIVKEMSKPFDLDALLDDEKTEYKGVHHPSVNNSIQFSSSGPTDGKAPDVETMDDENNEAVEEDEAMTEENDKEETQMDTLGDNYEVSISTKTLKKKEEKDIPKKLRKKLLDLENAKNLEGNLKLNKAAKLALKKKKKNHKRSDKIASKLSDTLEAALTFSIDTKEEDAENDNYDFATDYLKPVNSS